MTTGSNLAPRIPYDDLREWLAETDRLGELAHVKGASWQEEIGQAADVVVRGDAGPAVLFDEVPGCPKGHRVLVNMFAGRRRNMTFGFPAELDKLALSEAYYRGYLENQRRIPFRVVESGPVLAHVLTGEAIDVTRFPAPVWHKADGGRYIGTGCYCVTRDPEEGWINVGTYRSMVHGPREVGVFMVPGKHGHVHREKYFAKAERMPIVMILGGDPITFFAASTEAPVGVCEFEIVGGMRGKPVDVVTGRVTGLPFPATAEIALEGWLTPGRVKSEGPFGEWTGYYASGAHPEPVLEIEAIYHRSDPIILGVPPIGGGADEMARYRAVMRSAMVKQNLVAAGVPDVTAVWCHEVGSSRLLHGIAIRQRYPGHARQAGHIAAMCAAANYSNRYVIVVDDDVDVSDLDELVWAWISRADPAGAIDIIRGARISPAEALIPPEKRALGDTTSGRAVIDACRPFHWRDQYPKVNAPTAEAARRARSRFGWLLEPGAGKGS